MRLPKLNFLATASANIQIANGTDENGDLKIVGNINNIAARFEQSNSVAYTKEGTKVSLKAKLFIFERLDEFPDDLSGFCTVNDVKYDIIESSKKRNPDNSVHHVVLGLNKSDF